MVKKKIMYIISNVEKSVAFEWIYDALDKRKFDVEFVLLNPHASDIEKELLSRGADVKKITYTGKKTLFSSLIQLCYHIKVRKPDVVHCHLFDASLIGLAAAKITGVKKRIHTRHHSSYHHDYFPKAVKYDKLINMLSTTIIAISKNVKTILIDWEKAPEQKVQLIYHGFKEKNFMEISEERIRRIKEKYNYAHEAPIIGVISRYTEWKGIQYIIPAFKSLLNEYPNAKLILANAKGDYSAQIKQQLLTLPEGSYREIEFEVDNFALFKTFDVFVHTPINYHAEAFGQIYIEAMACKIPTVCTASGVAVEFLNANKNCILVKYKDVESIYQGICVILQNKEKKLTLVNEAYNSFEQNFGLKKMINSLERIYED